VVVQNTDDSRAGSILELHVVIGLSALCGVVVYTAQPRWTYW
jgi:hypothetical protein